MTLVTIDYKPRPHQRAYHNSKARFRLPVWHRRAGKTIAVVNDLSRDVLRAKTFMPLGAYIAPLRNQAKRIAWPLFQHFLRGIPEVKFDQAELCVTLPGGRRIFVLGGDNPDAIRGLGLDAVVFDETAQIDPGCWTQVVRPGLADKKGRATFIGTPKGRMNLLFDLWEKAFDDRRYWGHMLKASESGVLPDAELRDLRRDLRANEYEQELECSFNAAITGSYYAKEMAAAEAEGRITSVRYDKTLPVTAALDLGWSDLLVAWYAQRAGSEVRILGCDAWSHTSLADMVEEMRARPFPIHQVIAPPDIKQTELGSGTTRLETLYKLGVNVVVAPRTKVDDGIEAVRDMLPRCVFDYEGCQIGFGERRKTDDKVYGLEALVQYRTEYDSVLRVYSRRPLHDWASHYADGFRYLAVGLPYVQGAVLAGGRRRRRRGAR